MCIIIMDNTLSNNISSESNNKLSNSQKLRNLITSRNDDDLTSVYNTDIVEIFLKFNGIDIPLKLKEVVDCEPPMFDMIASNDIFIPCEKESSFIVNDEIKVCIRYEEIEKIYFVGDNIALSESVNKFNYPKYIAPSIFDQEVDIIFDIYYDPIRKGLTHPVVKLFFSKEFWKEFKQYQQYLL